MDAGLIKELVSFGGIGILAVCLILGIVQLWKFATDQKQQKEELKTVVQASTQASNDTSKAVTSLAASVTGMAETLKKGLETQEASHSQLVQKLLDKLPATK